MAEFKTVKTRMEFHTLLKSMFPNTPIYFQPPETIKMTYPCIVYNIDTISTRKADSKVYNAQNRYSLYYITNAPDDTTYYALYNGLQYVSLERYYRADNLNHYLFTIFY